MKWPPTEVVVATQVERVAAAAAAAAVMAAAAVAAIAAATEMAAATVAGSAIQTLPVLRRHMMYQFQNYAGDTDVPEKCRDKVR